MNTKTTISISEARKNIFDIAKEVQKPNNHYTFTENGKPKAVLMSAEEFESWQETLEVMAEFPDLDTDVREVEKAVKTGTWEKWPTLDEVKREWGVGQTVKSGKKHEIRARLKAKSKKVAR